ncbi:ketoacyl-synt-domain-containing protein [Piromyces finnis]|uniref:Ketoacyl-synt-domain-containing protein n=1 Tax=Piromyces finnis TaxID=1754191 RepID=A0A1Y1VNX5_9FUNG|nr:ketoacyl-synt-domain-containing protein [Piromyces finnis]|eukprot:ORX61108.1 ketoacyl-synt-domain-containing protein [Piromyces finnis]
MVFIDETDFRGNLALEKKLFLTTEDEETKILYDSDNIIDKINIRFSGVVKDKEAIIAKENILPIPFKGVPSPNFPEPWLTVSFEEFLSLIKALAYVLKKKYDFAPGTRVGIIANSLPMTQLMIYALWMIRCIVVNIPPKLGNDVKQYWVKHCDVKMIFYDMNFRPSTNEEENKKLNKQSQWIWKWYHDLTEEDEGLSAGKEGVLMSYIYDEEFRNEILQTKLEGKGYERKGDKDDVLTVIGTSSSSQAIIKNGQYSSNVPFHHAMGVACTIGYSIGNGSGIIYHTQQLQDIGFIPEMVLDDMAETRPLNTFQFPFHYGEYKKLFDNNHPRCSIWKKYLDETKEHRNFVTGGGPLNPMVKKWFIDNLDVYITNGLGSTEGGNIMFEDYVTRPPIPGEEGYFMRIPWIDFLLKPLNDDDPNIGELYTHSDVSVLGYFGRAKPGEFYDSPVPGMRCDIGTDEIFVNIHGKRYYKTNDIVKRSPISGRYRYVSRIDSIITFATGLKMNPLPFEGAITYECKNITRCCLILDFTQTEVVCFVEPNWNEIIIDNKNFDTSIDPSTLDKETIKSMNKAAKQQTWNSIYKVLMDEKKSLTSWTKQLTINNIYIIDYGKKFPSTDKGSLSRRVARLQYNHVLKYISKLISGEITEIPDEPNEPNESNENGGNGGNEIVENKNILNKTNENFSNKIQANFNKSTVDKILDMEDNEDISKNDNAKNIKVKKENSNEIKKSNEEITKEIEDCIMLIYQSIKEIIPSTPDFELFNPENPFNIYGIDSLSTIKLTNILSRKLNKYFSPAILFNYGNTYALAKFITGNTEKRNKDFKESIPSSSPHEKKNSEKIAIIGMGLRLPGAINNAKSLWMSLAKGKDCVLPPLKNRDLHRNYVNKPSELLDPSEHNIPRLGLYDTRSNVAKPSQFDAAFFNCLPDEALSLDPRHRWILETSWEALENANIAPNSLENSSTGVFVGINDDHEYSDLMTECGIETSIASHGSSPSGIAGRLSYFYRLYGPSFTIDTACSTGATALHTACRSLQHHDCNLSIVSGVKYMYSSKNFYKTCAARMTSPHGRCATFDKDADGFVPSEGCVTFILKRLDDAIRDNDNILSVILSTSSGQSGLRQSISAPSSEGQAINMRKAMEFAGIKPEDVSYIEAHGTGTPLGDALEVHALNEIYAGSHTEENPLVVGSIKTNIGHTCETAGLAGIAKVIVSMQHKYIPKNLHFNTLNPEIDVKLIPMKIPTKNLPWNSSDPNKPLIAQVSSYGLQGSIIHVFLEEYIPKNKNTENNANKKNSNINRNENENKNENENENEINEINNINEKENHILTISAKSYSALVELCNTYMNILEKMEDEEEDVSDLCYSSNVGRQQFDQFRLSVYGKNASELYNNLEIELENFENRNKKINDNQSSYNKTINQTINIIAEDNLASENAFLLYKLLVELYISRPEFKQAIEECDAIITTISNNVYSLVDDITSKGMNINESKDAFKNIKILSFYYALSKVIDNELNVKQSIFGGYGLGEIISILINNGISIEKAIRFLKLVNDNKSESDPEQFINSWYNEKEKDEYKLNKNVYSSSHQKILTAGEVISKDYYIILFHSLIDTTTTNKEDQLTNMCDFIIKEYGKKCKNISIFSNDTIINNQLKDNFEKKAIENKYSQITGNKIISFFEDKCTSIDECEKRILPRFISNNYNVNNEINWNEFHKRINSLNFKEYYHKKVELPNYPFQRSTYWPKPINKNNEIEIIINNSNSNNNNNNNNNKNKKKYKNHY